MCLRRRINQAGGRTCSARQESDQKGSWGKSCLYQGKANKESSTKKAEGKRQTFPLSTGRFTESRQTVPLKRGGKRSRKEKSEEDFELKEKSMKFPGSEIKR